jgi:hypothetical protein
LPGEAHDGSENSVADPSDTIGARVCGLVCAADAGFADSATNTKTHKTAHWLSHLRSGVTSYSRTNTLQVFLSKDRDAKIEVLRIPPRRPEFVRVRARISTSDPQTACR